jgi:hypothetical protein
MVNTHPYRAGDLTFRDDLSIVYVWDEARLQDTALCKHLGSKSPGAFHIGGVMGALLL